MKPGLPPGMVGREVAPQFQPQVYKMRKDGERNWVLHLNILAVQAMRAGDRDLAKHALDESILYINDVFGRTPEARRARSLFFDEGSKLFKGDPYERAMTFFYRGVLYMQDQDWDNARAMFRSASYQDQFVEEQQNASDWVIFDYMIGVCEVQMGRPFYADEAFTRAQEKWDSFRARYPEVAGRQFPTPPAGLEPLTPEDNLLVIVQTGKAPEKYRTGGNGQFQGVRRAQQPPPEASVHVCDDQTEDGVFVDSVYFQAKTRGGRPFDAIAKRKVIVKEGSDALGQAGIIGGAIGMATAHGSRGQANAGLAMMGAGLALSLFSHSVQTGADIRQWPSLPDALAVYTSSKCSGEQSLRVWFAGSLATTETLTIPQKGQGLAVVLAFPPPNAALLLPPQK